jgi:hypothetical protein
VTVIEPDLPPELFPIAYLLGTWRGEGVGGYPGVPDYPFAQEISFTQMPGMPVFSYTSRVWDPESGEPIGGEAGFWRTAGTFETGLRVEVTLAHPTGIAEVYVGDVDGAKIELSDNVTVRTATARQVERSQRLYGLVEGDLAYAIDIAAEGEAMRPYMSARLVRVTPRAERDEGIDL